MRHRIGVVVTALATLGLGSASFAMMAVRPDVSTHLGRLLCAGALANASLALTMFLIAVIPLRHRQRWAFWALCAPIAFYGVPMLILDGTNVRSERLVSALAPQVTGIGLLLVGLALVRPSVFGSSRGV
ncbi:MAG TPA: hypothetical protein VEY91_06000 [Candidatus Limnocylindria bacterium]|nr:hypothetical protein [Candidatus Limnocylindria bacterium]